MDAPPPLRRTAMAIDTEALLADSRWLVALARALMRHAGPRRRGVRNTIETQSRSDPARIRREATASPPLLLDGAQEALEQVRRLLERGVAPGVGSAAYEGVAAIALLWARLRKIAARGGGGGAAGRVAAPVRRANATVIATRSRWPTLPLHRS